MMAAPYIFALFAGLSIASLDANAESGASSLLSRIESILGEAGHTGGINVAVLDAELPDVIAEATGLRSSLTDQESPLAQDLTKLLQAAQSFLNVDKSNNLELTSKFNDLSNALRVVRTRLTEMVPAGTADNDVKRKRHTRLRRRISIIQQEGEKKCCTCCGASACGDSCTCSC